MTAYLKVPGVAAVVRFDSSVNDVLVAIERAISKQAGAGRFHLQNRPGIVINFNTLASALVAEDVADGTVLIEGSISAIPQ